MSKKQRFTNTGRYFAEKKPLAIRSAALPKVQAKPGRMPFLRMHYACPTPKVFASDAEFAAQIGPTVAPDAVFFLDTSIFSTWKSGPLWDLFLSRQILIPPMVQRELLPWLKDPHQNQRIRDLVYTSVKRQLDLGKDAESATPSPVASSVLATLGVQVRFPNERYHQHGFEYYYRLLAVRKLMGPVIATALEREHGRPPTNDEFVAAVHSELGERGLQLAQKGREGMIATHPLADEQSVVMAMLTAILEGREVYVVTMDTDLPEQFGKLFLLIKEHYRAMLVAERYAEQSIKLVFRELLVTDTPNPGFWAGPTILEARLPEAEFDVLPHSFRSVVAHCILLGRGANPTVSYSWVTIDADTARVLQIKAATGGRSTDRLGDLNCTIRTSPLTPEQHEVVISIGKENAMCFEGWGAFGADDWHNVLASCEEVTQLRAI